MIFYLSSRGAPKSSPLSSCRHTSHADTLPLMSTHTPSPLLMSTHPLLLMPTPPLLISTHPKSLSSSPLSSYRHTLPLSTCRHSLPLHMSACRHTPPLMAPSPHTGTPSCLHTLLIPTHPSPHALLSTHPMPAHTHTDTPSLLPPPYVDTAPPLMPTPHAYPSCPPHIDTALCRHAPLPLLISTRPYADTPSVLCALPAACCISLSHCTLPLRAVLLVRVSSCSFVRPVQMCKDHPVTLSTHTPSNSCDVHHMTLVTTQRQAACPCSRSTHYLT